MECATSFSGRLSRELQRLVVLLFLCVLSGTVLAGPAPKDRFTSTTLTCAPDPATLGVAITCTATVSDIGGTGGPSGDPQGSVNFSTAASGVFSPTSCTLAGIGGDSSSCSVSYTPTGFDTGSHLLNANYTGGFAPIGPGVNWQQSAGSYTLTVRYPAPGITSITPDNGVRGDTVAVTVTGSNFYAGATSLNLGANITVSNLVVVDGNTLTADLTIDAAAVTGLRDVTVSNPTTNGGGGTATLANGFEVRNPLPVITALTPASVLTGSGAVNVIIDGSGFVPDSVAYFNGNPRTTTFINNGQLEIALTASDTSVAGSYPIAVINPAPGGGTSNAENFNVVTPGGSFDAVEPGGNPGDPLYLKLAGTGFSVDLLATNSTRDAINTGFTGDVRIELLDAGDDSGAMDADGCRASWTVAATLPNESFTAGDNGRITINLVIGNAMRVARFRIISPPAGPADRIGCSSDAFSVRPTALDLTSSLNNGTPAGNPTLAAGDAFSMSVNAIAGYDGTPQVDATLLEAHADAITEGNITGTFPAADIASGSATGNSFEYDEVGAFRLTAGGIYDDTFTAIDQPDDCTDDFSNTLNGGLYGCKFGNAGNTQWVGRFVPHHFDVLVTEDGCTDSGGFTYSGQPIGEVVFLARNAGGTTTQNFAYTSGDLVDDNNYSNDVTLSFNGTSAEISPSTLSFMDFSAGTYTATDIAYTFADPETVATDVALRATDSDGVTSDGFTEEATNVRSGRVLVNGITSTTANDAVVPFAVQSWQETSPGVFEWAGHADDTSCTTLAQTDFTLENFTGNLDPGDTGISAFSYTAPSGSVTLSAPGPGNTGTVDLRADLTGMEWLQFDYDTDGTADDPVGVIRFFEIFETEDGFIYRREVIN